MFCAAGKLHDIHPYTYLTDVLLRIGDHPASRVAELTPRQWKEKSRKIPCDQICIRQLLRGMNGYRRT